MKTWQLHSMVPGASGMVVYEGSYMRCREIGHSLAGPWKIIEIEPGWTKATQWTGPSTLVEIAAEAEAKRIDKIVGSRWRNISYKSQVMNLSVGLVETSGYDAAGKVYRTWRRRWIYRERNAVIKELGPLPESVVDAIDAALFNKLPLIV